MVLRSEKMATSPDGAAIYYDVHAGKHALPTVVLVHGIGGDTDGWQYVRTFLDKAGYRTVAFDQRGHGYSDHPRRRKDYAIERVEDDILAVLLAEKIEKPILIGHSGGAIVAARFAANHPGLLGGLVLIAGSYRRPAWLSNHHLTRIANAVITVGGIISPPPYKRWHSPYPRDKFHKEVEVYGLVRTMFYNSLRSYLYTSYELINIDLRDQLTNIKAPTLLIAGEDDGIFPVHISVEMQEQIAGSQLVILPDTNHVSVLNNAQGVAYAILNFLKN